MSDARREARGAKLDEAIDLAVREMLDVEPPADLRAKVIARIDVPEGSASVSSAFVASAFRRKIWSAAAIASAASLLIVILFLARRSESPAQPPIQARAGADQVLPAPQQIAPAPIARAAVTHVAPPPAPIVNAASSDTGDAGATIEPLNTIVPLEVVPIAQNDITPEPIGVRPLNPIPEMQIAPLNPPDRRD